MLEPTAAEPPFKIHLGTCILHFKLRKVLIGVCAKIKLKITAVITETHSQSTFKPNDVFLSFIFIFIYPVLEHKTNSA
jgi:hypothetical protein